MRHARLEYASFFLSEIGQGGKFKEGKSKKAKVKRKAMQRNLMKVVSAFPLPFTFLLFTFFGYDVALETRFAANFCFVCYIYSTKLAAANFLFIHR